MNLIIVLPIIVPLLFAVIMLFFWKNIKAHKILNVIASICSLAVAIILISNVNTLGILALQVGSWQAPFGISIVADLLTSIMVLITSVIGLATAIYSLGSMDEQREKFFYYPLLQFLLMGINGAFLTGDIFNLYVWFEVMLISSFVLLALGGKREQLEGAIKYVTLNLLSSAIFLAAVGILYGIVGTLNMADVARKIPFVEEKELVTVVSFLFMVAFGIKAAVFPLFFWLPASYHTPPIAVSAIFAGLLTKVGVYALIRVFTLIFIQDTNFTHTVLLVIAGFTMLTGVLGAASQNDMRKILSFHIISQIGYMIMGLALFSPLAIAGAIFYIIHHIIVKTNLFLVSGVVDKMKGSFNLKKIGGLYRYYPLLGLLFLIPALSLAGIPPLSGFWAKFVVIKAGLEIDQALIVIVALVVGILTLFSMTKIWNEAFWKDDPKGNENKIIDSFSAIKLSKKVLMFSPIIILALITIIIGFNAEPFFNFANNAASQLLNPSEYISKVLGL
ncbi:MAG: Na+/H+ antiporter subunit D [Ignavibacteria bacterium]|nr:Na+/H+ antiporter subunit D [Ignavibacteria bacterium]MBT8381881.1 Na+/H+ antiporter subunit D [Ignavibacteria bacterium]MBT8391059.1 Na+/H+ antiporter subunit D [Ignavibacteria bacterium]NNJ54466.1 Na+/H+ antiporter subunit D [Ignavibacteriaceae bacterium]NNL21845.1 Na+/H+ antiporter subunit D [Ignavibacteriaceae bacterium]